MKCDMKTMLKGGLGLALITAVAYAAMPQAREWIIAASPFLFFLICPLMMLFMMNGMHSCHSDHGSEKVEPTRASGRGATNAGDHPSPLGGERHSDA